LRPQCNGNGRPLKPAKFLLYPSSPLGSNCRAIFGGSKGRGSGKQSGAQAGSAWGEFATAAVIFIVTLLIYLVSPVVTSSKAAPGPVIAGQDLPYQLVRTATGIYSLYPVGTPLMVVPYVAFNDAIGSHLLASLERNVAPWHDHIAASVISAAAVALLYLAMRRREASVTGALLAITAFALGTTMWTTASRGLWQHGPLILCFAAAIYFLARQKLRLIGVAAAGFALGYAVLIRQVAGLALIAIGLALLRMNWRAALMFGLAALPPILINILYDWHAFGWIGNPYVSQYTGLAE
jgi:hypothetical protein